MWVKCNRSCEWSAIGCVTRNRSIPNMGQSLYVGWSLSQLVIYVATLNLGWMFTHTRPTIHYITFNTIAHPWTAIHCSSISLQGGKREREMRCGLHTRVTWHLKHEIGWQEGGSNHGRVSTKHTPSSKSSRLAKECLWPSAQAQTKAH